MALGDGIRRNIARVSQIERDRYRDAVVLLNSRYYPDGVSKWVKQDEIHEVTHVHDGPSFLTWHRELCNRYEALLREIDPDLSLHYWDWTQDPRDADDGSGGTVDLLTTDFMGAATGAVGAPFAGFPSITRNVNGGAAGAPGVPSDNDIITFADGEAQEDQYNVFRRKLEGEHGSGVEPGVNVHGYIGGSIGNPHTAFEDPFVFLLHSNVDRLFAMWQTVPGQEWRLDPAQVYGVETSHITITENMEPWAGGSGLRPWAPPDNQQLVKSSLDITVVAPPCYDTLPTHSPLVEVVNPVAAINFNDVPEGETTARAASFRIYGCSDLDLRVKPGTEPAAPFSILTPGGSVTATHAPGQFVEARIWFGFTGQTPATAEPPQNVTIEAVGTDREFDFTLTANSIAREEVAVMLVLDQSGSMDDPAGTTGSNRIDLLKESAAEFVNLVQADNGVGLVRFDHDAYPVGHATYPGFPVTRINTDSAFDPDRIAARNAVSAHATNPMGATSIGDGVEMGRSTLDPVTGYDHKALVVFTDGLENRDARISDVLASIDSRTFAIGLGNAQQVSTAALNALTQSTGGYLLLTGSLSGSLDHYFLLTKYFLQVLASVTNNQIIVDPNGFIGPGVRVRIPFDVDEGDIICTPILLHELPIVRFSLEAPNGAIVMPADITALGGVFNAQERMSNYRFTLPSVAGGVDVHGGRWHAVLEVDEKVLRRHIDVFAERKRDPQAMSRLVAHGVRYSFTAQTYSNLRMDATLTQDSLEPGATLRLRAKLREYGIPVERRARVRAEVHHPDGTTAWVDLFEQDAGMFETTVAAARTGVYRFRVIAEGHTLKGRAFTREQLLTGAALIGGDGPWPFGRDGDDGGREDLCRLVECLIETGAFAQLLDMNGVDPKALLHCLKDYCQPKSALPPR